jgi:hypothetical protein
VAVSARGLLATGLSGYNSTDIDLFELGIPSAIFAASTGAPNYVNGVVAHGLDMSADGSTLFAVTSDNIDDTAFQLWAFSLPGSPTATTVSAGPSPVVSGSGVTLTATVTGSDDGGSVSFDSASGPIAGCEAVPLTHGSPADTATCTTGSLPAGSDTVGAEYSGDLSDFGSYGSAAPTVLSHKATTLSVSTSPATIYPFTPATVTVTVKDAQGDPVAGDTIAISGPVSQDDVTIGPVTDHGDGTYTATATAAEPPTGLASYTIMITATDTSVTPNIGGHTLLGEIRGNQAQGGTTQGGVTSQDGGTSAGDGSNPSDQTVPITQLSRSDIRTSLGGILLPRGYAARIRSILRRGTYQFSYAAPGAGVLTIHWYHGSGRRRTLIASGSASAVRAGRIAVKVKLTNAGRSALGHARQLALIDVVGFKPRGDKAVDRSGRFALR